MMKAATVEKEKMTWRKPRLLGREYELLLKGQPLAYLRQTGWWPVQAHVFEGVGATDPVLRATRSGVWRQKLHVKTLDYRLPQMTPADLSWRGEVKIELDNGRAYHFHPTNFWQTQWELNDAQGTPCLFVHRNTWGFGGEIVPGDAALLPDEMRFLIYVAWNVIIMKMDDQAAAAA